MRHRIWIASVIAFAALAAGCSRSSGSATGQDQTPIALGATASPFTLESANGKPVSLSDYAGKPALLYFSMGPG